MNFTFLTTFLKTIKLIDRPIHLQAFGILLIIVLGALLETLGVGLIFPFMQSLVNPGELNNSSAFFSWFSTWGQPKDNYSLIVLSALILVLFLLKNVVLLIIYFVQAKFAYENMAALRIRLYGKYLQDPYSLHLSRNSADLIENIHVAAYGFFSGGFIGFLALFSECILIAGLIILLLFIDPITTLGAGFVLGLGGGVFFLIVNPRIEYWGERSIKVDKKLLKSLQEGFHNFKAIKVLGREDFVLNDYNTPLQEAKRLATAKEIVLQAPRLWIETVGITAIMSVIIYLLIDGKSVIAILPVLTVFAAVAVRLIPSINRLLIALNRISVSKHAVDVVFEDLKLLTDKNLAHENNDIKPAAFEHSLKLDKISFKYTRSGKNVLDNITLSLKKGQTVGIVGPSGAGKSTLVDIILGLLAPTSGSVLVDGVNISNNVRGWQRHIGYVPQSIYLLDGTLKQNIALGIEESKIDKKRIETVVRLAQLDNFIDELPNGLSTTVGEHGVKLSGGQRQRVGIARALYHNPNVICLDEATSALDSATEQEVSQAVDALSGDKTIIIIAHRISTVQKCDFLVFLNKGKIEGTGSFQTLLKQSPAFQRLVKLANISNIP